MTNVEMLLEAIEKSGLKKGFIATACGMSRSSFLDKSKGKVEFTATEIVELAKILNLTTEQRDLIFLGKS